MEETLMMMISFVLLFNQNDKFYLNHYPIIINNNRHASTIFDKDRDKFLRVLIPKEIFVETVHFFQKVMNFFFFLKKTKEIVLF